MGRERTQSCILDPFHSPEKILGCFCTTVAHSSSSGQLRFLISAVRESSFPSLFHRGRTWYILSLTLCRFLAWNYFAQLQLEVLQLTRHPENWTLQARWRLVGLPIHMLFLRFYKRDKEELYR